MALRDELSSLETVEELRAALRRTQRTLDKERRRSGDITRTVAEAVRDAASSIELQPVRAPRRDRRAAGGEIAACVLSDWQCGKQTPTYSSDICAERVDAYAERVIKIAAVQRADHPVDDVRVWLMGDMVEGELIFPGQAHEIDSSLFSQVMRVAEIQADLIRRLAGSFTHVHVEVVPGNHGAIGGRARREMRAESNADNLAYQVTRTILEPQKRVSWGASFDTQPWYVLDQLGRHRAFLFHGDNVRGHAGIPWYGFERKIKGWATGGLHEPVNEATGRIFDYAFSGHFHTPFREYINGITHWGNGSTESTNPYAAQQLAASGEPAQWLLFFHPERGVTAEYLVSL